VVGCGDPFVASGVGRVFGIFPPYVSLLCHSEGIEWGSGIPDVMLLLIERVEKELASGGTV
jgi:hypothetical protein